MAFGSQAAVSEAGAAFEKEQSAKPQAQGSLQRFWGARRQSRNRKTKLGRPGMALDTAGVAPSSTTKVVPGAALHWLELGRVGGLDVAESISPTCAGVESLSADSLDADATAGHLQLTIELIQEKTFQPPYRGSKCSSLVSPLSPTSEILSPSSDKT